MYHSNELCVCVFFFCLLKSGFFFNKSIPIKNANLSGDLENRICNKKKFKQLQQKFLNSRSHTHINGVAGKIPMCE